MNFFNKFLHFGLVTYLAAMLGSMLFALAKINFTGNEVGRIGLIFALITTGLVVYRLANGMLPHMNPVKRIA